MEETERRRRRNEKMRAEEEGEEDEGHWRKKRGIKGEEKEIMRR